MPKKQHGEDSNIENLDTQYKTLIVDASLVKNDKLHLIIKNRVQND
jgi:hypothetical protein